MHDFPSASKEIEVTVEISTWLFLHPHPANRGKLVRTEVGKELFFTLLEKTLPRVY